MSDKLKKASPWDVESSAPPPPPRPKGSAKAMWLGKPIMDPGHARDLDQDAAISEFGLKMPREKAEEHAYNRYVTKQRTEAAAHHLRQSQVARAAGDLEGAAKHGMMYNFHAKAIGHDPAIGHHPAIQQLLSDTIGVGKHKFVPHKADSFAIADHSNEPVISSAPAPTMGKSEALQVIATAVGVLLAKAEKQLCMACKDPLDKDGHCKVKAHWAALDAKKAEKKPNHCKCESYPFPHRHGGGRCKESK